MDNSYTYFKILLRECLASANQVDLKIKLINNLKENIDTKILVLNEQITSIKNLLSINIDGTVISKLHDVKELRVSLEEKRTIIKSLENSISSLNVEVARLKKQNNINYYDPSDGLPF